MAWQAGVGGFGWGMARRQEWAIRKGMAAAILGERGLRRQVLGGFTLVALAMLAVGLWGIDEWLAGSPLRFLVYWAACALWCLWLMLFALYDLLAAINEERARHARDLERMLEEPERDPEEERNRNR